MSVRLLPIAIPLLCFAFHMTARFAVGPIGQKGVAVLVACASLCWLALGLRDGAWPGVYFLLVALFFGYAYFHLFNMALTARRIELLIRKLEGREEAYEPRQMVERRIARLCHLGTLERKGERLRLKKGLLLPTAFLLGQLRRWFYPRLPAQ